MTRMRRRSPTLVVALAASCTARRFGRFRREHVFRPLGMTSSYLLGARNDPEPNC